jgi:hypothetical protein
MGGERSGCGGGLILAVIVALAVLVAAALFVGKLAEYNDAEASRLYARGALEESYARAQGEIIRAEGQARADMVVAESQARLNQAIAEAQMALAQGQARLDSAQAFAVTAGAALPWLVVALVGVAGVVLLAAIVAIFSLSLAALRGQPALPRSGRVMLIDRPARLALPQLQEPEPVVVVDQRALVKRQDE